MESTGSDDTMPPPSRLENELHGSPKMLTGQSQMITGAEFADPDLFASGVISALQRNCRQLSAITKLR
jgi:hypothetical protein